MTLKKHFLRHTMATVAVLSTLSALPAAAETFSGHTFNLTGTATMVGSDLQLTSLEEQSGAAWLTSPLSTSNSFSASFSFSLSALHHNATTGDDLDDMADGITLTLQNLGTSALGQGGGNVGYTNQDSVGSIIQTWDNNRVGLNTNGELFDIDGHPTTKPAPPLTLPDTTLGRATLVTGSQTITYNASTSLLSMVGTLTVDGNLYNVSDTATIDLSSKFGPIMYLGFTGGTGLGLADQRITSFSIAAVPEPEEWAMMLMGAGMVAYQVKRKRSA